MCLFSMIHFNLISEIGPNVFEAKTCSLEVRIDTQCKFIIAVVWFVTMDLDQCIFDIVLHNKKVENIVTYTGTS